MLFPASDFPVLPLHAFLRSDGLVTHQGATASLEESEPPRILWAYPTCHPHPTPSACVVVI
ncbi:hypothetical protein HaLaN_26840 [Haematococcus lacustris]|uniref:Uncharacterized protein n=1 Tax=Haematococcus lacustris TaxID=44745 RepID=A0A6A0A7A2_HAELA|nr:hypothetical protein HaLaN_26840 [Haematococcus lacustris]